MPKKPKFNKKRRSLVFKTVKGLRRSKSNNPVIIETGGNNTNQQNDSTSENSRLNQEDVSDE